MLTKLGVVKKNKKCIFFLDFQKTKNMEPSEIQFLRAPCFLFFQNRKKMHFLFFFTPPNFVNISIFHTFLRVLWDIVATSCMLPYKCHTYLKSLWSLVFVGIRHVLRYRAQFSPAGHKSIFLFIDYKQLIKPYFSSKYIYFAFQLAL